MNAVGRNAGAEPFGATLLFSLLLHGLVILGVTFHYAKPAPSLPTLDVTLVDVANRRAPVHADFLAQLDNQGGGEQDRVARPSAPVAGPLPIPTQGTAPRPVEATEPRPQTATPMHLITTRGEAGVTVPSAQEHRVQESQALPDADERRRAEEMAALAAELRARTEAYAKRPKKKFISANTREYAYAAYMRGWVDRVERIGNLNYPEEARRRGLHGELELTVTLARDGSVKAIDVTRSSGQPILDRAAIQIVRLAAPFAPIPSEERIDELHITRTWQFLPGGVLRNR
ncbi:energy transducer TonB [Aerosticca soli]|uniref:Ferric siderophore transport system, periplasmic binding protein TonB n=1 Tax=Aerosticca soli TaxID=2010829 RepID=A0A2Z6E4R0_9GAMM|nr:energy transducer TonB [Aerosticca soli]MDI3262429.1 TonB family protein [Fulvimonas sp.]BBD80105.1 ferric siderophore transport system, periplasmic binding protein TonB [Aerosticca soli]